METTDCEKLKQGRDDAYTQLVLVKIEAKDFSARKGFLGIFGSGKKTQENPGELAEKEKDIQERLAAAQKRYEDAKRAYEESCKK